MNRKILAVCASVAIVVALMAIPVIAQATQVQESGKELANGSALTLQSTNLKMTTQTEGGEEKSSLFCKDSELEGTLVQNQAKDPVFEIPTTKFSTCDLLFADVDITTNASAKEPWQVRVQEPIFLTGQTTVHIEPYQSGAKGKLLEIRAQFQQSGVSYADCNYIAKSIQLMGDEGVNSWTVEGTKQFQKSAGTFFPCDQVGDLSGSFISWGTDQPIVIDGTPI